MKITGFSWNLLISVKITDFLQISKESLLPFGVLVRNVAKSLIFSQISQTDWVQNYWKFTDFTDFTENSWKYEVLLIPTDGFMSEITDFTRIYWKLLDLTDFTDFIEITDFTEKYQVFQVNAVPFR